MTELKISHEANQAARAIVRMVETKTKRVDMDTVVRIAAAVQTAINASSTESTERKSKA